jgi:hypothetical protein
MKHRDDCPDRRFVMSSLELRCDGRFAGGQEITDGCVHELFVVTPAGLAVKQSN